MKRHQTKKHMLPLLLVVRSVKAAAPVKISLAAEVSSRVTVGTARRLDAGFHLCFCCCWGESGLELRFWRCLGPGF